MQQISIFDFLEEKAKEVEEKEELHIVESLSDYAFLYTSTAIGQNSGIHFMMTLDDAMKWCESDLSYCC